jgi:pimeloyl-ACP methyl ester carboxylesterase
MKWQVVETKKGTRCRVLEGGSGAPVVFFHGAGGLLRENPYLDGLAQRYHVYAPEWPGYGDSTGEELLEDMLDFALHGWDLVDALGLSRPHLAGHSMGGMIAAEMACLAPRDLGKLALAAPAGLWMDEHPIPDIFAMLPYQLAEVLFHDPAQGQALLTGGADLSDMEALKEFYMGSQRRLSGREIRLVVESDALHFGERPQQCGPHVLRLVDRPFAVAAHGARERGEIDGRGCRQTVVDAQSGKQRRGQRRREQVRRILRFAAGTARERVAPGDAIAAAQNRLSCAENVICQADTWLPITPVGIHEAAPDFISGDYGIIGSSHEPPSHRIEV